MPPTNSVAAVVFVVVVNAAAIVVVVLIGITAAVTITEMHQMAGQERYVFLHPGTFGPGEQIKKVPFFVWERYLCFHAPKIVPVDTP